MFGFLLAILTFYILSIWYFNNLESQILEEQSSATENLISVYLENEEGDYVLSESTNFDQGTEYVYNEEKSYCVNESVLSYNEETSKISVTASGTDNCYVYFDEQNSIIYVIESYYCPAIIYINGVQVYDTAVDSIGIIECKMGDVITFSADKNFGIIVHVDDYNSSSYSYSNANETEFIVSSYTTTIEIFDTISGGSIS